jgi:nicotinate-nucleotide pyrophosphorylase (carboxylating)
MKIDELIGKALEEDMGDGDYTSLATIPADATGSARLLVKEDGIIAGVGIARMVFQKVDRRISFNQIFSDGDHVKKGEIVFTVKGPVRSILSAERLVLNFMQRMSGIATFTASLVSLIEGLQVKILDTRKTTPLLRELEKMAVRFGGGENHRMGLYDMIMIKDNHVDFAGGIRQAIEATNNYLHNTRKNLKVEIEVRNFEELGQVLQTGSVNRIMLDNFSPADLKKAVILIGGKYETEASGGITTENIRAYAATGVDFISVGALTHHIKSLDLSLKAY